MTHLLQKCESKGLVNVTYWVVWYKGWTLGLYVSCHSLCQYFTLWRQVLGAYSPCTISTLPSYVLFYHSSLTQCLFAHLFLQARSVDSCISFTYGISMKVGSDFLGQILPIVTIHLPHNHSKEDYSQSVNDLSHISSNQTFSPHNYNYFRSITH